MRDHIFLELTADASEDEIAKLKQLLTFTGGIIDIEENLYQNRKSLIIKYETNDVMKLKTRNAGRKKIGTCRNDTVLRIGEVKKILSEQGQEAVLQTLHISRATYFRRWKSLREKGYTDQEDFWNQRFFI